MFMNLPLKKQLVNSKPVSHMPRMTILILHNLIIQAKFPPMYLTGGIYVLSLLSSRQHKQRGSMCKGSKKPSVFIQEQVLPLKSSSTTKVKAKSRPHTASSSFPLLEICFRCPHCGIVGHIVVSSEQLHFLPRQEKVIILKLIYTTNI